MAVVVKSWKWRMAKSNRKRRVYKDEAGNVAEVHSIESGNGSCCAEGKGWERPLGQRRT